MPELTKDPNATKDPNVKDRPIEGDMSPRTGSAQNVPRDSNARQSRGGRGEDTRAANSMSDRQGKESDEMQAEEGEAAARGREEQARLSAAKVGSEPHRSVHGDQPPPPEGPIGPISGKSVEADNALEEPVDPQDDEEMMEVDSPRAFTLMLGPHEVGPTGQTAYPLVQGRNRIPARLADHVVFRRHGIRVDNGLRQKYREENNKRAQDYRQHQAEQGR
jgi:hypothetical protein